MAYPFHTFFAVPDYEFSHLVADGVTLGGIGHSDELADIPVGDFFALLLDIAATMHGDTDGMATQH